MTAQKLNHTSRYVYKIAFRVQDENHLAEERALQEAASAFKHDEWSAPFVCSFGKGREQFCLFSNMQSTCGEFVRLLSFSQKSNSQMPPKLDLSRWCNAGERCAHELIVAALVAITLVVPNNSCNFAKAD